MLGTPRARDNVSILARNHWRRNAPATRRRESPAWWKCLAAPSRRAGRAGERVAQEMAARVVCSA